MNGRIERFGELGMRIALATFAMPTPERLRFIRQLGVDDVIVWGTTFGPASGTPDHELCAETLLALRAQIEAAGNAAVRRGDAARALVQRDRARVGGL